METQFLVICSKEFEYEAPFFFFFFFSSSQLQILSNQTECYCFSLVSKTIVETIFEECTPFIALVFLKGQNIIFSKQRTLNKKVVYSIL